MLYLGIDCGLSGALAILNSYESRVFIYPTPILEVDKRKIYNFKEIKELLDIYSPLKPFAIIEKQWARPIQGCKASFYTGMGYATWLMALTGACIPYMTISPNEWKKHYKIAVGDKNKSIMLCQERFPSVDLKRTPRCKKACTDFADALLLAEYGRVIYNERNSLI